MDSTDTEMKTFFEATMEYAANADGSDPLKDFRSQFNMPCDESGNELVYLCGNSLGLQPKTVWEIIDQELGDWKKYGVEGHFHATHPWMPYHEYLTNAMAGVVGAKPIEVVMMNTLSVNLHLMMVSFYRPVPGRYKIMIESDAFPSDLYAVESQARFHGYDPGRAIVKMKPREGESLLRSEDIRESIDQHSGELALIMLGGVNYYTGQLFDLKKITDWGHKAGAIVAFDLAHAVGNIDLQLHDDNVDFAVWCTYKYLNSGPGAIGGCFVHERHAESNELPRFAGWWGHNKETRFNMRHDFDAISGAEGWQLSNPPILSLAPVWASLKIFEEAGMKNLREKSRKLTGYLEFLLHQLNDPRIRIITPENEQERGCQLSIQVQNGNKELFDKITEMGVIADWREPDVIRVAPVPLYNTFKDVYRFAEILGTALKSH